MEQINTEKIMAEIKAEIARRGYTDKILSFDDIGEFTDAVSSDGSDRSYNFNVLTDQVNNMNAQYNVLEYRIYPNAGVLNKIKGIIKKVIRKPIRFYINPIVTDQNEFNASAVRAMNQVRFYIAENEDLKSQIEKLTEEVELLKSEINKNSTK